MATLTPDTPERMAEALAAAAEARDAFAVLAGDRREADFVAHALTRLDNRLPKHPQSASRLRRKVLAIGQIKSYMGSRDKIEALSITFPTQKILDDLEKKLLTQKESSPPMQTLRRLSRRPPPPRRAPRRRP